MADCKGMAVRDFFVWFGDVNMPVKFRWARTNCKVGLAVSNFPGGAVELFGHARFRQPIFIEFFTGPDVYTEFQEFSCMLRPPKGLECRQKVIKNNNNNNN